ncbi:MAG: MBL fold metallo-hydrolase [Salinirussus sp.]
MNPTTDWFDVTRYSDSIREIEDTEGVRIFLVEGEERALVIDAGRGIGNLRDLVAELTDLPVTLALTHWHWDHIGSAAEFEDVRIHPAERAADGRVTVDAVTDEFVGSAADFIDEWRAAGKELPAGIDDQFELDPVPAENVSPLAPGDHIDLGDRGIEAIHIPGHTPGQLALLDREAGVLFGADVIHRDLGQKLHFETGDVTAAQGTFADLVGLREAGVFDALLTCHNPPIEGADLDILRRYRNGLAEIIADKRDYSVVDTGRTEAREYRIAGHEVLTQVEQP